MSALSTRTAWQRTPNALSRVRDERARRAARTLDLTRSNPTELFDALGTDEVFARVDPEALRRYDPDPQGALAAREAIARRYSERGVKVDPSQLVLCASTSEAYGWLFKLLCDPGEGVAVLRPSYPLFDDLARLEGVCLDACPLERGAHWSLDVESLARSLRATTRAVSLVHPNNPTGRFIRRDAREALVALAAREGRALILDEVFLDYAWSEDARRSDSFADEQRALTFTLDGLSKLAAAPQVKLGWIVVSGPEALRREALARLELIADCYLSVSAAAQHLAPALLGVRDRAQRVVMDRIAQNLRALDACLDARSAVTRAAAEGGWYACARLPATRSEEDWVLALLDAGVLVQPGWFYDFDDAPWIVLSLISDPTDFAEGISIIDALTRDG